MAKSFFNNLGDNSSRINIKIVESDICECLKIILKPLNFFRLFENPLNNSTKESASFFTVKSILALISFVQAIRFISNLLYRNFLGAINYGFVTENIRAIMSNTSNGLTFYWTIKQSQSIRQVLLTANDFNLNLPIETRLQLKRKITIKAALLLLLGFARLGYLFISMGSWDVGTWSNRMLFGFEVSKNSYKLRKLMMGFDDILFQWICFLKLMLIAFYISICFFIREKIQQFNCQIDALQTAKKHNLASDLRQLNRQHASMTSLLIQFQSTYSQMTCLWFFDFLVASFYYFPKVARFFGMQLTGEAVSKIIELWFHLYLMAALNLSMADVNTALKDRMATLHHVSNRIDPSDNDERFQLEMLLMKLVRPAVVLTGARYVRPSRRLLITAISAMFTYGALMYQIFPDFFKSTSDWAG